MKFKISKAELYSALSTAWAVIWWVKADSLIFDSILIHAVPQWIMFKWISWWVSECAIYVAKESIEVIESWKCALPAKKALSFVGLLWSDEDVTISTSWSKINFKTVKWNTKFSWMDAGKFPEVFTGKVNNIINVPSEKLIDCLRKTIISCLGSDTRPTLWCVNISFSDGDISFSWADALRFSFTSFPVEEQHDWLSLNVHRKTIATIIRSFSWLDKNQSVKISVSENSNFIRFESWPLIFMSLLVKWNYPNIKKMTTSNQELASWDWFRWTINRQELINWIKRVNLFAIECKNSWLFSFQEWQLKISSPLSQTWESEISLDLVSYGEDLEIKSDTLFFLDILNLLKCEFVDIYTKWNNLPVSIFDPEDLDYKYVLAPQRWN